MDDRELIEAIRDHAKMCVDFGRMGSGEFRRKYPDYDVSEGVNYLTKKAEALATRATRLEALQAQPVGEAIGDIAAERQRQIAVEGWAPDHDDAHTDRALAQAGACYVLHDVRCLPMDRRGKLTNQLTPELWPWEPRWWKPKSYRENLVRGAALIVAEIERLDREASRNG